MTANVCIRFDPFGSCRAGRANSAGVAVVRLALSVAGRCVNEMTGRATSVGRAFGGCRIATGFPVNAVGAAGATFTERVAGIAGAGRADAVAASGAGSVRELAVGGRDARSVGNTGRVGSGVAAVTGDRRAGVAARAGRAGAVFNRNLRAGSASVSDGIITGVTGHCRAGAGFRIASCAGAVCDGNGRAGFALCSRRIISADALNGIAGAVVAFCAQTVYYGNGLTIRAAGAGGHISRFALNGCATAGFRVTCFACAVFNRNGRAGTATPRILRFVISIIACHQTPVACGVGRASKASVV